MAIHPLEVSSLLTVLLPLPITLPAALVDLRRRVIPDGYTLALLAAGLIVTGLRDPDVTAVSVRIAEAALAYGLFWTVRALHARLRGQIGLGLGDVKFLGAATAWTGLTALPILLLVASVTALAAFGFAALTDRRVSATTRLPFGPFLALGLHAALFLSVV